MHGSESRVARWSWLAVLFVVGLCFAPTLATASPRLAFTYNTPDGALMKRDFLFPGATWMAEGYEATRVFWSPGGRYALLMSGRWDEAGGVSMPRIVDARTGASKPVLDTDGLEFDAGHIDFGGFSRDGTRFAFVYDPVWDESQSPRLLVVDSATASTLGSTGVMTDSACAISPEGDRVAYNYNGALWMFSPTPRVDAPWLSVDDLEDSEGFDVGLVWPTEGAEILLNTTPGGSARSTHIDAIRVSDKSTRLIKSYCGVIIDVSPNGRWILTSSLWPKVTYVDDAIARVDANGGPTTWLMSPKELSESGGWFRSAKIAPDGSAALFSFFGTEPGDPDAIVAVRHDGVDRHVVAHGSNPWWQTDGFTPVPYGWSVENGRDENRDDDWAVWQRVFGDGTLSRMRYSAENGWFTWAGKSLFGGGVCRGFAASALANYVEGGPALPGVTQGSPGFGSWSALSFSPNGKSGYPRLVSTTEAAIRERVEFYQLLQSGYKDLPVRTGARAAAAEAIRRLDAGEPPVVLSLSAKGEGHALVPFKYERVAGQILLYVYDCNWPGDTTRYININGGDGAWAYTLWQGEDWTGADKAMGWSTYEDIAAARPAGSSVLASSRVAATDSAPPLPVLGVANARVLAVDSSGRRLGYLGSSLVNEIPGAVPTYPDPTDASGIVRTFRLGSSALVHADITPLESGPWSMGVNDADSALTVESSGQVGETGRVTLSPTLDAVSFAPQSGVSTVTMWAGSWADGGKVQYGVIEATTTASDLRLSADSTRGRLDNLSTAPKSVTLAAIGDGWVGRRTVGVVVPAHGYVEFAVTSQTAVNAAGMTTGVNGAPLTATASAVYGTSRVALSPIPPTIGYLSSTKIQAQSAEAELPVSRSRLEVSYDDGKHWSSLGSFTSRSSDGYLVKSVKLARNCLLRARVLASSTRLGSTSSSVAIAVRASLTTPSTAKTQRYHHSYSISGYLKPRHTSGSKTVSARCYRFESGEWVYHKSVSLHVRNHSSYSRYSGSIRLTAKGKWRVRVYHSDASHAPTYSHYRYVTVK